MNKVLRAVRPWACAVIAICIAGCSKSVPPAPPAAPAPAAQPAAAPPPAAEPMPAAQPVEKSDLPFIIAEVGSEELSPIARFTGQEWVNTWPEPDEDTVPVPPLAAIPDAWLGQPVPREWQLWTAGKISTVKVIDARRSKGGCWSPAVLVLEKPAGSSSEPTGRAGFAVNTNQVIDQFRVVDQKSEEWRGLGPGFLQEIKEAEQLAWLTGDHSWVDEHLIAKNKKLIEIPAELTVSQPMNPDSSKGSVYYFELQRKIHFPDGVLGFKLYGWIRSRPTGTGWLTESLDSSSITEEGEFTLSPLVRIRHSGRDFWLMFVGGIESGGFAIYEVTADKVVRLLDVGQSGC